jgi:ribosomal protein S18 acetylase RimI-like enzyme
MTADPRIVEAWVRGWALAREAPPPVAAYGGYRVDVGLPDQQARYVFPSASKGVSEAAAAIDAPHILLKICTSPDEAQKRLTAGWVIQSLGFMMDCSSLDPGQGKLSGGYRMRVSEERGAVRVQIVAAHDGRLAACGTLVFVDGYAIFDRVSTHIDHRRRGLGRAVMERLSRSAGEQRASHGLLVATADGRALYEALGWRLHSLYTTAIRPA